MPMTRKVRSSKRATRRVSRPKPAPASRSKATARLSPPVVKAVKKIIRGQEETKYVAEDLVIPGSILPSLGTFQQFSSAITGTGELYACLPRINQGVDDFNRVGNSVQPVSCHVDGLLNVTTNDNSYAVDYFVHVFVLQSIAVKSLTNLSAVPIGQLFENGAGGYISADGTTKMSKYPINRTDFKVLHHRRVRLTKCWGQTNGIGGALSTTLATQDSKNTGNYRFRLPIKLPKKLKYDVASQQYPSNSAPFLCIAWEQNDYAGDSAPITSIYAQARVHLRYKDA